MPDPMREIRVYIAQLRKLAFEQGQGYHDPDDVDAAEAALLNAVAALTPPTGEDTTNG
jgi:hypothetical protein